MRESGWSTRAYMRASATLGAYAWTAVVVWPRLSLAPPSADTLAVGLLAPVMLVAGLRAIRNRLRLARWLLFAGFPTALALAVAKESEATNRIVYSPVLLLIAALALLAFGACALGACSGAAQLRSVNLSLLRSDAYLAPKRTNRLRIVAVGWVLASALVLATWPPSAGGVVALREAWGEASNEGALLTAVGAAALAVVCLIVFVPKLLREEPVAADGTSVRTLWSLLLAGVGFATYLLLQEKV